MTKKLKVIPLNDRIYIEPYPDEGFEKTASGIIIATSQSNDNISFGKVLAVGTGRLINGVVVPFSVKVGDEIAYTKRAITEYVRYGKHVMIKEADILSIHEYEEDGK
jgi:chaperonin GroES